MGKFCNTYHIRWNYCVKPIIGKAYSPIWNRMCYSLQNLTAIPLEIKISSLIKIFHSYVVVLAVKNFYSAPLISISSGIAVKNAADRKTNTAIVQNVYKIKKKLAKVLMGKFAPRLAIVYILWYNEYVEFSVCMHMYACCKRYA